MLTIKNYFTLKPKKIINSRSKIITNESEIIKNGLSNLYFAIIQVLPMEHSTSF